MEKFDDELEVHENPHSWAENPGHDDFIDGTGFPVHGKIAEFAKELIKEQVEMPGAPPKPPELKVCNCVDDCEHGSF